MRPTWRGVLGLIITVLLLWWVLRDVSPALVLSQLARSNMPLLALATALATSIFALRAARWLVILEPTSAPVGLGAAWRATTIGMMVNNVVPARAGELARAYALSREVPRVPFSTSIASLVVDRAFDSLVLVLLGLIAMLDPSFPSGTVVAGRTIGAWVGYGAILALAGLGVLYLLVAFPRRLVGTFQAIVRRFSPGLQERGSAALHTFGDGLTALKSTRLVLLVLLWTVAHWLVYAASLWLGFRAVGIEVPVSAALFLQALVAFGVAVPAAPGFFGVSEALTIVALGVYGVDRSLATTFAIGFHILTFIPVTVIGALYAWRLGLRWRELKTPQKAWEPRAARP